MIGFVFAPLLIAALACLALSSRAPTRWLGLLGALASLASAAVLVSAPGWEALAMPPRAWMSLGEQTIVLTLQFDELNWPFALLVTGGGALALLSLALALPNTLRGFGGLFAALLLSLAATLAGLAVPDLTLLPFVWALAALLAFSTLRASGAYAVVGMPLNLLAGLASALALLGAALALASDVPGALPPLAALAGLLSAVLAVTGAPPFHSVVDESAAAPAGLAGPLIALGLPLIGGVALLRFAAGPVELPDGWRTACGVLGGLTLVACAAGALGERRLSQLLGWQWSAQIGLVLLALGMAQADGAQVAAPLLANAVLTTLVGYLAVGVIERQTGTDDLNEFVANPSLALPGLAFLLAAASAVGVPGTWGFWLRLGLVDAPGTLPWAQAVVLAGSALLALAYLSPVAAFWRVGTSDVPRQTLALIGELLTPLLAALPLLLLGTAPQLYRYWPNGPQPTLALQALCGGAALLLLALPFVTRRAERVRLDAEERSTVPAPDALAESLRAFGWLAAPDTAFRGAWDGLQRGGQLLRRGLALFEQRYYLAGVLLAMVMIILLLL